MWNPQSSRVHTLLIGFVTAGILVDTGTSTLDQSYWNLQSDPTWGSFVPIFFKMLQENQCLKPLTETRLLSMDHSQCLLDQSSGNASQILSYLTVPSSPQEVQSESGDLFKNICDLSPMLRCYLPPCESCNPIASELQNLFKSLICTRKDGESFNTLGKFKENLTGFVDCFLKMGLQTTSPTGRCFQNIAVKVPSEGSNRSCLYARGIFGCISVDNTTCADENSQTIATFKQVVEAFYKAACIKLSSECSLKASTEEGISYYQISPGTFLSSEHKNVRNRGSNIKVTRIPAALLTVIVLTKIM